MGVIPSLVMLFVVVGVLIYVGMIYNGLVAMRNDIDKSWANIDVLLKQRHDEVPRLVDVCKGYMQYERETLQTLIEARARYATAATLDQKVQASGSVTASVGKVLAVAEKYPALQANASFLEIQKRISELENQIADRREFYNDSINLFNTRLQQMPDAFVARFFGMQPRFMFLVSAAEKAPVRLALNAPEA
ncbi:MAG TPA: LemA family protein [Candidatus Acidoferrum sp.]|nr:LemA family protein [Candidatus Acidoferrum sp.]